MIAPLSAYLCSTEARLSRLFLSNETPSVVCNSWAGEWGCLRCRCSPVGGSSTLLHQDSNWWSRRKQGDVGAHYSFDSLIFLISSSKALWVIGCLFQGGRKTKSASLVLLFDTSCVLWYLQPQLTYLGRLPASTTRPGSWLSEVGVGNRAEKNCFCWCVGNDALTLMLLSIRLTTVFQKQQGFQSVS